ncbi:hypothetical protein BU14_3037s0001, partial [Porphyra umbilicalis]
RRAPATKTGSPPAPALSARPSHPSASTRGCPAGGARRRCAPPPNQRSPRCRHSRPTRRRSRLTPHCPRRSPCRRGARRRRRQRRCGCGSPARAPSTRRRCPTTRPPAAARSGHTGRAPPATGRGGNTRARRRPRRRHACAPRTARTAPRRRGC